MPPRNLLVILCALVISLACYAKAPHSREARTLVRAMNIISERYVEPVEKKDLFENAMNGMVQRLDQHSGYITPERYRELKASLEQEFGGIGIIVDGPPRSKRLKVVSPLVGTPAYEAGIRADDVILAIDGTSTEDMALEDAVPKMRGPEGSKVKLTILHVGEEDPVEIAVRRGTIQTDSVLGDTRRHDDSWNFVLESEPRIGYIRITSFGDRTLTELETAIKFNGRAVEAVILDLRGNAGGLLNAAVATCDMFLERGRIVSTRSRGAATNIHDATAGTRVASDVPMVVMVDRLSASASEIVAACLKDHKRAVVCGQRTWGKGSVQNIIELEGGDSALKLTTATYWRPNGKNIHRATREYSERDEQDWGVRPTPGLEVILTDEQLRRLWEARRTRDIVRKPKGASAEETKSNSAEADPQLQSAIKHLLDLFGKRELPVRKA